MQDNTNIESSTTDKVQQLISVLSGRNVEKLTNWKKEPTVEELMHDYRQAQSSHKYYMSRIQEWLKLLHPITDKNKVKEGRSGVVSRMARKLAEWRYSALASAILNERNLFQVTASAPAYIDASFQNTLVLNYQFNTLIDKVHFINTLVRTMVNEGTAIVRVGWEVEQQTKEKEIPVYQYVQADEQGMALIMQAIQQINQEQQQTGETDSANTETFKNAPPDLQESIKASYQYGQPVIAQDTGQTQIVKELVTTKNRPSVKVINTADLVIDPTCDGDFSKARFVVYRYETDLSTLRMMNQREPDTYNNLKQLDPNAPVDISDMDVLATMSNEVFSDLVNNNQLIDKSFKFKDEARKKITVYEYWGYWDIDGTGIAQAICATIANGKFIKLERNPFPDNELPFVVIPYLPVKQSIYGEPDSELISDNQQISQALTRAMVDINARSANGQVAMPKGFLDIVNKQRFNRGEDYEYNPVAHPSEAIYMHTANELPQSMLAFQQMQYAEAEAITGVKSFSGGIDGNAYGQVAAGMSQAVTAINQREGDIMFRISRGLEKIGNKILAMNMEWLDEEEIISLTQFKFVTIRREDLKGDFHLAVKVKSNSESEGKAQQLTFMAQTLGEQADWGLRKIMLMEIGQLYNLDTFVSAIKDYEPQPDPIQQELARVQLELEKAKLAKEQAETEYYQARSAFIDAQIGNTQADTDLKALDFMEQQEGVKHARQREIVQAQAEAQNRGKIATELLKGQNALHKAQMDNDTKRAVADAKGQDNKPKKLSQKAQNRENARQAQNNLRKLPNPELGAVPDGLFKADGLGNYIHGDGRTVQNQI